MNFAVQQDASDVFIQTGERAGGDIYGHLKPLTNYTFQYDNIIAILRIICGNDDAISMLAGGQDYDHAFNVSEFNEDGTYDEYNAPKLRFRLNATAIESRGGLGIQLVMRYIPSIPPTLSDIGFPEELIEETTPELGQFLMAGTTGSGKSTSIAACLRNIIEGHTHIEGNILTYEKPVEYLFSELEKPRCRVAQSEIGRHIPSFAEGIRNAMRRKPAVIFVGELRDEETIAAATEAATTGHLVYATVHANDVTSIISRMVQKSPEHLRDQAFSDIVQTSRLLMSQALVPSIDGKRVCLRDWVVLDPNRQEELLNAGYEKHRTLIRSWSENKDRAQSMKYSIEKEHTNGRISDEQFSLSMKKYGYML